MSGCVSARSCVIQITSVSLPPFALGFHHGCMLVTAAGFDIYLFYLLHVILFSQEHSPSHSPMNGRYSDLPGTWPDLNTAKPVSREENDRLICHPSDC